MQQSNQQFKILERISINSKKKYFYGILSQWHDFSLIVSINYKVIKMKKNILLL
jgi:hypothetical protein